jgi:hypothetical protein
MKTIEEMRSLSPEERGGERSWGEFAESQLTSDD